MRVPIREQLGLLVLLTSLIALAVISIATWVLNSRFVASVHSAGLTLTASLKAAQVSANLLLLESSLQTLSTRILIQAALQRYRENATDTQSYLEDAHTDLEVALSGGANFLLQATISVPALDNPLTLTPLVSATSGRRLGSNELGFLNSTDSLYPNLTAVPTGGTPSNRSRLFALQGRTLDNTLIMGPLMVNSTFALISLTVPIINNTSTSDTLGYITAVINPRLVSSVVNSSEGLENSGGVLIVGPDEPGNQFPSRYQSDKHLIRIDHGPPVPQPLVRILWPPSQNSVAASRHPRSGFGKPNPPFPMREYPAVLAAFTEENGGTNNAGSILSSLNEENLSVAVGYARVPVEFCDWVLVVEQDKHQAMSPVRKLRRVLLACVFGTTGLILIMVLPIAHFSVLPIRRLYQATKNSVEPPGTGPDDQPSKEAMGGGQGPEESKSGYLKKLRGRLGKHVPRWRSEQIKSAVEDSGGACQADRSFKIPQRVQDRKHFVRDELSDLTEVFNSMADELMIQYGRLEERVKQRTKELELSKQAAEAANESKTLFVANISHELRTPLNAILGLTSVCMEERDASKIHQSLSIIYQSGDLLLHLLTDLLDFSKNQFKHQLTLDEKEFRLGDISTQILRIFEKQALEGNISLKASYPKPETDASEQPVMFSGVTRIQDIYVWGDQNRLLQVIINLVSNSLKFTPAQRWIEMRTRCLGEVEERPTLTPHGSLDSKQNATLAQRVNKRRSDLSRTSLSAINKPLTRMHKAFGSDSSSRDNVRSSSSSPHRPQVRLFEFEVEDSGPGIPEHLQEKIFEPFVQGDVGLSKKYSGTGLGLSICSQLARLMGGTISLRSQIGVGSVFTLRIPLKITRLSLGSTPGSISRVNSRSSGMSNPATKPPENVENLSGESMVASTEQAAESNGTLSAGKSGKGNTFSDIIGSRPRLVGLSQPFFASSASTEFTDQGNSIQDGQVGQPSEPRSPIRVLVAEDNKVNQEVVLRMLKLEHIFDITVAEDGQEAYDKVKESIEQDNIFNLVLMDVQMPNLDGLQSTRRIRDIGFPCPIIALTAFADEGNFQECLKSGMNNFLSKPLRRPALKAILKTYCTPIPELTAGDSSNADATPKAEG